MNIEVKINNKKVNYNYAINYMEKRLEEVIKGKKSELLWILEHNSIYTGGIRSEKKDILNKNIKVIKTNRGGKHTYHGPGQKIVYFVLNLNKRKKSIRYLIDRIENCIVNILKEYNIKSYPDRKNIGIWVNERNKSKKIAAIGIRVRKWIAYHGFCLNIKNELDPYKKIIPCGILDKKVTNLKKISKVKFDKIDEILISKFISNLKNLNA